MVQREVVGVGTRPAVETTWRTPVPLYGFFQCQVLLQVTVAALANVSAHELSEAMTDPASPGAWYDSSDQENGDKCAWTFNVPSVT